jgi:hypothetical protein
MSGCRIPAVTLSRRGGCNVRTGLQHGPYLGERVDRLIEAWQPILPGAWLSLRRQVRTCRPFGQGDLNGVTAIPCDEKHRKYCRLVQVFRPASWRCHCYHALRAALDPPPTKLQAADRWPSGPRGASNNPRRPIADHIGDAERLGVRHSLASPTIPMLAGVISGLAQCRVEPNRPDRFCKWLASARILAVPGRGTKIGR